MNLPISAPNHALATRNTLPAPLVEVSAGRPKFLPTHWPVPEVLVRRPALLTAPIEEPSRSRWPWLALKILAVALCYALVRDVEAAEPLSLRYGEPQVLSALGEPVDIRIPILSKDVNPEARFILGQQDGSAGLPTLRHANIRLERDRQGWALRIQSTRRSTDPAMAVVVQELVGGGMVSRTLPVLFDPTPANAPSLQVAEAEPPSKPVLLGATGESWWTAAVGSAKDSRLGINLRHTATTPEAASDLVSRPAVEPRQTDQVMARRPQRLPANALARSTSTSPKHKTPTMTLASQATFMSASTPRLRLSLALGDVPASISDTQASRAQPARRLHEQPKRDPPDAAVAELVQKVVSLKAQVAALESRLSEVKENNSLISPSVRPGKTASAEPPVSRNSEYSQLAMASATPREGFPWGLPLAAGLVMGAGYWSGRSRRGNLRGAESH